MPCDAQRRLDLEDVAALTGRLDDDPEIAHALADGPGLFGGRTVGIAVA